MSDIQYHPQIIVVSSPAKLSKGQMVSISVRISDRTTSQPMPFDKLYMEIINSKGIPVWPLSVIAENTSSISKLISTAEMSKGYHTIRITPSTHKRPIGTSSFEVTDTIPLLPLIPLVLLALPTDSKSKKIQQDIIEPQELDKIAWLIYRTELDHKVCVPAYTLIKTIKGHKFIKDIKEDDLILTRNDYHKCTYTFKRNYKGKLCKLQNSIGNLIATYDHPIWSIKHGWKQIQDISINEKLQSFNNKQIQINNIINFGFSKSNNNPTFIEKFFGSCNVFFGISMPKTSVTFKTNSIFNQGKINRMPSNLVFLFKVYVQRFKCFSKFFFNTCFALKRSITRKTTKESKVFTGWNNSKFFITFFTILNCWRSTTNLRTMFRRPSKFTTSENLFTPNTSNIKIKNVSFTSQTTIIIPSSYTSTNHKSLFTSYTNFKYFFCLVKLNSAFIRTMFNIFTIFKRQSTIITIKEFVQHQSGQFLTNLSIIKYFIVGSIDVYNLEIESEHEFFANKILVHNCDICKPHEGKMFRPEDPNLVQIPVHPRCRCNFDFITVKQVERYNESRALDASRAYSAYRAVKIYNKYLKITNKM